MVRIVVVGGGVAGFSAAMVAKSVGADEVVVIERSDALGGLAQVAGIGLCGAGAFSVLAEAKALGGARLYTDVLFPIATHAEISTPGFDRAMLYNVTKLDARMQRTLYENGIDVRLGQRVVETKRTGKKIDAVVVEDGTEIAGNAFVDATGSVTGMPGCVEFGSGCVECILRCPTLGDPKGLVDDEVELISITNSHGEKGVTGTSYLIPIASLSDDLKDEIRREGYVHVAVPPHVKPDMSRAKKAATFGKGVMSQDIITSKILFVDIGGYVKATANAAPRFARSLREIPGLEDAMIAQPLAGHRGHLVEGLTIVPRDNTLQITGFDNLLCGGIKSGHSLFIMDVACSGDLAGYNAVRKARGKACRELPKTLMIGALIDFINSRMKGEDCVQYSSQGSVNTLTELGVYRENEVEIVEEVNSMGLRDVYRTTIV
jgi:hypothetical protein